MKTICVVMALVGMAFVAGLVAEDRASECPGPDLTMPVVVGTMPHPIIDRSLVRVFGGSSKLVSFYDLYGKEWFYLYASSLIHLHNPNIAPLKFRLSCWIGPSSGLGYGSDTTTKQFLVKPRDSIVVEMDTAMRVIPSAKTVLFSMYCADSNLAPMNRHNFDFKYEGVVY